MILSFVLYFVWQLELIRERAGVTIEYQAAFLFSPNDVFLTQNSANVQFPF